MNSVDLTEDTNNATMPFWIVPKIQSLGINGFQIKEHGGPGYSNMESGAIYYEMSKKDASVATFVLVHNAIGNNVVAALGDEEQKKRILSETVPMHKYICFGLTEPDYGSDATSLVTNAKKVEGGYLINGSKRWIGNATFADYIIVWAKNPSENNNI
jgi:alkylation response protein AidB-like acyl-CoA dehydrogenase